MNLQIDNYQDVAVVSFPTDFLDASNADDFMKAAETLLAENNRVVLDLANLETVDSSGFGAIAFCVRRSHDNGGTVKVCSVNPSVQVAFDLVHANKMVGIYSDREAAIASFSR